MPECQVLGPVQVRHDGETVDIGGPKPRTLIALLAARAGEAVSTDSLIDSLWGKAAPDTASNTLQSYVSRLRKAIGTDAIESTGSGYRLSVSPATVDALKFESLARQAHALLEQDAARASDLLREGLDLWRGRPFEDTVDEGQLRPEVTRLEELRLVAIEDRNDAELMLGRHGPLVGEIEALLQDHPWRERLWAQLMTAQYRGGRQGEALRTYQRARRVLGEGLGIEPSVELQRLEEQILLQDPDLGDTQTAEPGIRNPFKGLHAFKEGDAQDFYGRRRLTAQLLETLGGESRFLAVIGPGGSGKSSVVRAGLIPALRKGALPTSDQWLIAHMLPGAHPFAEFEAALLRAAFDPPDSLSEQLANGDLGILTAALRVLPHDEAPLLLLIDQFEELFSLVENESVRQRFLANLMIAASDPRGRIRIVVTMRADFFDRPLLYPEFGELRSAVTEPATAVGVTIEPALLTELITDVVTQPGALPLFQYTLTELFARRSDDTLDVDEYRRIGGINGALVGRAEDLYSGMTSAQQEAAGQLFLRLVTVSDHTEDTRRRVRAGELIDLDLDPVVMQEVIEAFGKHRLLTIRSRDRHRCSHGRGSPRGPAEGVAAAAGVDREEPQRPPHPRGLCRRGRRMDSRGKGRRLSARGRKAGSIRAVERRHSAEAHWAGAGVSRRRDRPEIRRSGRGTGPPRWGGKPPAPGPKQALGRRSRGDRIAGRRRPHPVEHARLRRPEGGRVLQRKGRSDRSNHRGRIGQRGRELHDSA